jgi:hypothetical protein
MAVEVHVEGRVESGRMPDFAEAVDRYRAYAASNGYGVPQVLVGLSGPMNTVRLVYRYDELSQYDEHEFRAMTDREYGQIAAEMGFTGDTLTYAIYREL